MHSQNYKRRKAPKAGQWLLTRFLTREEYVEKLGDFEEGYALKVEQRGLVHSLPWYWLQIIKLIPVLIKNSIYWSMVMFRNYLKIGLRHLVKNSSHTFINISGLSISLAVFLLIIGFVQFEFSYDSFHKNADSIYRVNYHTLDASEAKKSSESPIMVGPLLQRDFPEIAHIVRFLKSSNAMVQFEEKTFFEDNFFFVDPAFFTVFDFELQHGDENSVLQKNDSVLLTEETAQKYFGNEDAMGKTIALTERWTGRKVSFIVRGVIKNPPANSHIKFDLLAPFVTYDRITGFNSSDPGTGRLPGSVWTWNNTSVYVHLSENIEAKNLQSKLPDFVERRFPENQRERTELQLMAMKDIHLESDISEIFEPGVNWTTLYLLLALALLILVISCINFMNLTTAKSIGRGKEVGMRKVLGARKQQLMSQYLLESLLVSFMSVVIALTVAKLALPVFNELTGKAFELQVFSNGTMLLTIIVTGLLVGLVSGFYPAFFLSAFIPIKTLKGSVTGTANNATLRRALVIAQFAISIALISGTIVIYRQLDFVLNKDLGFVKENMLFIEISQSLSMQNAGVYQTFKSELLQRTDIKGLTTTENTPGEFVYKYFLKPEGSKNDELIAIPYIWADKDFVDVFDIKIIQQADSDEALQNRRSLSYVVNEAAVKALGWEDNPLGKRVDRIQNGRVVWTGTVKAVAKDFHINSLYHTIEPTIIAYGGNQTFSWGYLIARIETDNTRDVVKFVEDKWNKVFPQRPFKYFFLDEVIDKQYRQEERLRTIFLYLAGLGIFIACLGLFALASFSAEQKTKEIGIRKVLGATPSAITYMLSKEFLILVILSNIIAWPLAYFSLQKWLENFAYRVNIGPNIFLTSAAVVLLIAILTVSYRALKAAIASPVTSLRYD